MFTLLLITGLTSWCGPGAVAVSVHGSVHGRIGAIILREYGDVKIVRRRGVGARREIIDDLLIVGDHMARLNGTQPFDPTSLLGDELSLPPRQKPLSLDETWHESSIPSADLRQIFGEDLADRLEKRGVIFRRMGTGELFFIALNNASRQST